MNSKSSPVTLWPDRSDSIFLAVASFVFAVAAVTFGIYGELTDVNRWVLLIPCYVGGPFFGLCFLLALRRFSGEPLIVIGPEGVRDNSSLVGTGLIRWDEIRRIFPHDSFGQRYVGIDLHDPATLLSRQPSWKRILLRLNARLLGAHLSIAETGLPISAAQLMMEVSGYLEKPSATFQTDVR
jgi:hypothetical protein